MADNDIMKMKVADLKRELRLRGLPITGNKSELQERLQAALIDGDLSLEYAAISEDLLDEDGLTDEEEKAVLDSPTADESELISLTKIDDKPISLQNLASAQQQQQQQNQSQSAKKVVLKRKNSLPKLSSTDTTSTSTTSIPGTATTLTGITISKENSAPSEKIAKLNIPDSINKPENNNNDNGTDQKKVIKLSELSMKERLEMRAKKFGTSTPSSTTTVVKGTPSTITVKNTDEKEQQQIQTLKKRAERFGCVVSSKIAEIEKQEKLLKRQQRFGNAPNNNETTKSTTLSTDAYAEKARLRLERFKTKTTTADTTK